MPIKVLLFPSGFFPSLLSCIKKQNLVVYALHSPGLNPASDRIDTVVAERKLERLVLRLQKSSIAPMISRRAKSVSDVPSSDKEYFCRTDSDYHYLAG